MGCPAFTASVSVHPGLLMKLLFAVLKVIDQTGITICPIQLLCP